MVHNPGGESEFREFNDYFLFPVTDNLSLVFGDEIISNIHRSLSTGTHGVNSWQESGR